MKTSFKLFHDQDWDEYQVQVFEDGILNESKTYHTDDRDDAAATLAAMKMEARETPAHPTVICRCDYLVRTQPDSYTVRKGDTLKLTGYLMGQHPVLESGKGRFVIFCDQEAKAHFNITV